jgi:hypothetical protein
LIDLSLPLEKKALVSGNRSSADQIALNRPSSSDEGGGQNKRLGRENNDLFFIFFSMLHGH